MRGRSTVLDPRPIFANRLFSRRKVDLRARLLTQFNGRMMVVYARTVDLSRSGACVTLSRELASGSEVVLCLQLPGSGHALTLKAVVVRRQGFRAGLRFVQPNAQQRLALSQFCDA